LSWLIWNTVDEYGRQGGEGFRPVDVRAVLEVCDLYDATIEDFEKILLIEKKVFPLLAQQYREKVRESIQGGHDAGREGGDKYR